MIRLQAPILLTPGPLTTSLATRTAMLTDWGSWDTDFNQLTASVCRDLVAVVHGQDSHVCVPLQGSGTFSVEAAIGTLVPKNGKILVLANGAYGARMAKAAQMIGRETVVLSWPDGVPVDVKLVQEALHQDRAITHVGVIHCETATGLLNPLAQIATAVHRAERALIVDAMSSFAALEINLQNTPITAVIAASGKCLEGVPGMGFVIAEKRAIEGASGNSHSLAMDLADQYQYMQKTGQWRFTPPTHVVAALRCALDQYQAEGGQPARLARYKRNAETLVSRLKHAGLSLFLQPELQAPIILTFLAPRHADYDFKRFYSAVRERGFVLYPGKLTEVDTFRVGCIGAIDSGVMAQAGNAITEVMREFGWLA